MAQETASLVLKVDSTGARRATSDLDDMAAGAARTERASASLERQAKITGAVIGGLATGAIALIVRNTIEQERVTAQLESRLRSTGGVAGMTKQGLLDMASGLQAVTTFGDESIISAQSLLLTFTKIGRDVFPDALETVLDMSVAMGTDLKSSAIQLGKALNDPIKGVAALGEVGVQFSESQRETIKRLVETGKTAEAQRIILAELETQMGGSAKAARDTLGGALAGLKNSFGDLLEGDSGSDGIRGATQGINDLTATLNSQGVKDGFGTIVDGLFRTASAAATATGAIATFTKRVAEGVAARVHGAALDDLHNMGLEAERLRGRIERWDRRKWRLPEGSMAPGEAAARERLAVLERSMQETQARIARNTVDPRFASVTGGFSVGQPKPEEPESPWDPNPKPKATDRLRASVASASSILDLSEFTRGQINAESATHGLLSRFESLRAELAGPLAVAMLTYRRAQAEINAAQVAGVITAEEAATGQGLIREEYEKTAETIKKGGETMDEFAVQAARNMQSHFADFLFDPFADGVDGMVKGFAEAMRRIAAEAASSAALKAVGKWATGYTGTGAGVINSIGEALSANGHRAFGGPVQGGGSYIVGDRGQPEIFTPSTSGRITPMGTGSTMVKVNVQIENKGGAMQVESQQSETKPDGSVLVRLITNTWKQEYSRGTFDRDLLSGHGMSRKGTPRG